MKRIIFVIIPLWITLGCAHRDAGKNIIKLTGSSPAPEVITPEEEKLNAVLDSTFYIGYVDYFPETKEFYTTLFYKDGFANPDEEVLETQLDSLIFAEEDWSRERLPMAEAKKMLVLSGLDTIFIYNRRHQLISKGNLSRVEYLWDGLDGYFIGIFESDGKMKEQTEELYGISANYPGFNRTSFICEEIEDRALNKILVDQLNIDLGMNWDMRHFRTKPKETTYSIVSSYKMNSEEGVSYLTTLENEKVNVLNQALNDFHFLNILPLPVQVNGKPLLLISAGYPSSDILWDYLAAFDGDSYEPIDYNRVASKTVASIQD